MTKTQETMGGVPVRRTKNTELPTFNVGEVVRWDSQAGGSWKTKQGVVVEVIPDKGGVTALRKHGFSAFNSNRGHESYIVLVYPDRRLKGTYYWPVVSGLKKA